MIVFDDIFMNPLFYYLETTKGIEQKEIHHPEGDVFTHSLQVLKWAFKETNDTDLILAAMMHDIGKVKNSLGHEKIAIELLKDYLSLKSLFIIEHHMRIWTMLLGEMRKLSKVKFLINHPWLPELILLARWDKLGRNPKMIVKYDKEFIINKLNEKAELYFQRGDD